MNTPTVLSDKLSCFIDDGSDVRRREHNTHLAGVGDHFPQLCKLRCWQGVHPSDRNHACVTIAHRRKAVLHKHNRTGVHFHLYHDIAEPTITAVSCYVYRITEGSLLQDSYTLGRVVSYRGPN